MEKSAPDTLKIRKIRTAPMWAHLYGPYLWHYELTGKDGVFGSVESQPAALAAGLAEWRDTYPDDFTSAPLAFEPGDKVAHVSDPLTWFGTVEFGDTTGANVIELDGDTAWFVDDDIVKL